MLLPPLLATLLLLLRAAQPASAEGGWDMVDRFIGLRFECAAAPAPRAAAARAFALSARDLADELSAFGWVQVARNGSAVVGEFRGTHTTAPAFEALLRRGVPAAPGAAAPAAPCVTRHYPSTLIKLHFADFKVLEDARVTCFENEPHQCDAPL